MRYLDNAATTRPDQSILDSYLKLTERFYANPSSLHKMGRETGEIIDKSREIISSILSIKKDEIIFTSGASEANNIAIKGVCFQYQNRGKHIITTNIEHPSVLEVFHQLHDVFGYEISYLEADKDGKVHIEDLAKLIRDDTVLVSIMYINNELGSVNDVEGIGKFLKENYPKIIFHCDATQGFGKYRIDLKNIDLLSMSCHKIYGIKGTGILVKKENISLAPLIIGGHQEYGIRAGTSPFAGIAATAKTIKQAYEDMDKNRKYIDMLNKRLRDGIKDAEGVIINSPDDAVSDIINLCFIGKKAAIVSTYFEKNDICVSTTSACGSSTDAYSYVIEAVTHDKEKAKSSIRLSFSKNTTIEDIDEAIRVIKNVHKDIV